MGREEIFFAVSHRRFVLKNPKIFSFHPLAFLEFISYILGDFLKVEKNKIKSVSK